MKRCAASYVCEEIRMDLQKKLHSNMSILISCKMPILKVIYNIKKAKNVFLDF